MLHIESDLHARQGKAVTNFGTALPPPQSDLARDVLKDPYNFDFLTLADKHHEADVERGLTRSRDSIGNSMTQCPVSRGGWRSSPSQR